MPDRSRPTTWLSGFRAATRNCANPWPILCIFLLLTTAPRSGAEGEAARSDDDKRPGAREMAPGVSVDWQLRSVEIAGEIVLREGPLELLVCTPGTREHESIVVVKASPTHIYQAMGMLGMESGAPVRYDEKNQRFLSAHGERLAISIRYQDDGESVTVPASHWLIDVDDKPATERIQWVFAGSTFTEQRQLTAEREGTVVCVVDFASALITVDTLHTADNEALWLRAHTPAIPRLGTDCTVVVRPAEYVLEVVMDEDDRLQHDGEPITRDVLFKGFTKGEDEPPRELHLIVDPQVKEESVRELVKALQAKGIQEEYIHVTRSVIPQRRKESRDKESESTGAKERETDEG